MRRRTILIEQPPDMWIEGGLIYVDFGLHTGNVIAFRPSAWLATSAIGQRVTREWLASGADVLPHRASDNDDAEMAAPG